MNKILTPSKCLSLKQIQAYLKEDINEDDRYEVENHLLDCPLCSDAVEGFANTYNADEVIEMDFMEKDNLVVVQPTAKITSMKPRRSPWLRIAASLLLLTIPVAGYLYWESGKTDRMVASYFSPDDAPMSSALRSGDPVIISDVNIQNGLAALENGAYQKSFHEFQISLKENPANAMARYYAGIAALRMEDWNTAEEMLESTRINSPEYFDQASWHLAEIYFKQNKINEAKALLLQLMDANLSPYQERARQLYQEL